MLRCPECGSVVQEGSEFCPHCGRIMSDADYITEEEFRAYTAPKRSYVPILLLLCSAMLILPMIFGAFAPAPSGPDYGPMEREVEWDMYDYRTWTSENQVPIHHFDITYTVDTDDLKAAKSSTLSRLGSYLNERDAAGHYAVRDYVVAGTTVNALCYKLWQTYSDFVAEAPQYNTASYFADYLLSFVEAAVTYELDGGDITVEHWSFPVETLYSLKGDCEDSSMLLSAIYNAMSGIHDADGSHQFSPDDYIKGACCFGMPSHFMTGVQLGEDLQRSLLSPVPVHAYYEGGVPYYFCETTGEVGSTIFPIGYSTTAMVCAQFYGGYSNMYVTGQA